MREPTVVGGKPHGLQDVIGAVLEVAVAIAQVRHQHAVHEQFRVSVARLREVDLPARISW